MRSPRSAARRRHSRLVWRYGEPLLVGSEERREQLGQPLLVELFGLGGELRGREW